MNSKGNVWWMLTIFIWYTIIASSGVGILGWGIILPLLLLQRYSVHRAREKNNQETGDYKSRLKNALSSDWTYRSMKYNFMLVGGICVILIIFLISNPDLPKKVQDKNEQEHHTTEYSTSNNSDTSLCYELGVRFGRCGTLALKGQRCNPEDDIVMPERCRNKDETLRGITDGQRSVW